MRQQRCFELRKVFVAFDATESSLGYQQRRGSPAQHHFRMAPTFDAPGPGLRARKAALDQVGRGETLTRQFIELESVQRERFLQSLLQTSRGRGTDRLEPFDLSAQFFERGLQRAFGPRAAEAPGGLLLFLLRHNNNDAAEDTTLRRQRDGACMARPLRIDRAGGWYPGPVPCACDRSGRLGPGIEPVFAFEPGANGEAGLE